MVCEAPKKFILDLSALRFEISGEPDLLPCVVSGDKTSSRDDLCSVAGPSREDFDASLDLLDRNTAVSKSDMVSYDVSRREVRTYMHMLMAVYVHLGHVHGVTTFQGII